MNLPRLIPAALLLLVIGCAKPSVVGTYGFDMAEQEARIDEAGNVGDAVRKALLSVFQAARLELREDGTWTLTQEAAGEKLTVGGTYTVTDNKVTFKPGESGDLPFGAERFEFNPKDQSLTGSWAGGDSSYRLIPVD